LLAALLARQVSSAPPECWTFRHRIHEIAAGATLRIIVEADALVRWLADGWQTFKDARTIRSGLPGLWFADLPTGGSMSAHGSVLEWTFC
jgi:hypothetical protein